MHHSFIYIKVTVICFLLALLTGIWSAPAFAQTPPDGTLDTSFQPFTDANDALVKRLVIQPGDGKILASHTFGYEHTIPQEYPKPNIKYSRRSHLIRFNPDGNQDGSFVSDTWIELRSFGDVAIDTRILGVSIDAFAQQADGKLLIGGEFNYVGGMRRNAIARLNQNGTLDTNFKPDLPDPLNWEDNTYGYAWTVEEIMLQPDGKILIGGNFNLVNRTARSGIVRLNANGSLDSSFNAGEIARFPIDNFDPHAPGTVAAISLQTDGKILIAGDFYGVAGVGRRAVARLNADGSLDTTFDPGSGVGRTGRLNVIKLQEDGKVLIGGSSFRSFDGVDVDGLARLNQDGKIDLAFEPELTQFGNNLSIYAIAVQKDGKILVSGFNNDARFFARLYADGRIDDTFASKDIWVQDIVLTEENELLIGGYFSTFDSVGNLVLGKLHNSLEGKQIETTPPAVEFPTELAGSANPSPISLIINNAKATGDFNWTARTDVAWLRVQPSFGSVTTRLNIHADIGGLAPDTYTGHVILESRDELIENSPYMIPISIRVAPQNSGTPILRVDTPSIGFQSVEKTANPAPQSIAIENIGGGALNWTASIDAAAQSWLSLNQTNGSAPATVQVAVNTSGLSPGTYTGRITVQSAQDDSHNLAVILTITPGPTLGVSPTKVVFTARKSESDPPNQSIQVTNRGDGSFNWQAGESIAWLALSTGTGSVPANVTASAEIAGLDTGRHSGTITFSGDGAAASPTQADVTLGVLSGPILHVGASYLPIDAIIGQTNLPPQEIVIRNAGAGSLQWSAAETIPWLSLDQSSGTIDGNNFVRLHANLDITGLTIGSYAGQITFTSPNGDATPQTVNVTLVVVSPAEYCRFTDVQTAYLIESARIDLYLANPQTTFTATGCDLSGELTLQVNSSSVANRIRLTAPVNGSVDLDSKFTAKANSAGLFLEVGPLKLKLADEFTVEKEIGISFAGGQWELPALFGGGIEGFDGTVTIGPKGISIAGAQTFDLPDLDWGSSQFLKNKATVIFSNDDQFLVNITSGEMQVGVSGSAAATAQNVTIQLDRKGIRKGEIGRFTVPSVAGLQFEIIAATIGNNEMKAKETRVIIPKEWGGADTSIYDLRITKSGDITIGGARLKLPSIKAGDFNLLSLEGGLRPLDGGGYEIIADGTFGIPNMGGSASCSMRVKVTLRTGPGGSSILTIDSAQANAPQTVLATADAAPTAPTLRTAPAAPTDVDALRLDEVTLGLHCRPGIAIGTTGFQLTGVEGTVRLVRNEEFVRIKLWVETYTQIGPKAAVSAVPVATIYPKPFKIDFATDVYVAGLKTDHGEGSLEPGRFEYAMTFDYKVVHGSVGLKAGRSQGRFYFEGSGKAEVGVQKGSVARPCVNLGFRKVCQNIPPSTITVANATTWINLDGLRGSVDVLGYGVSFYFDFRSGSIRVPAATRSRLISSVDVAAAHQTWQAVQRGKVAAAAIDNRFVFGPNNALLINTPISVAGPAVQASNVITDYTVNLRRDVIFGMAQPPTGTLELRLHTPSGLEISPYYLDNCDPTRDTVCLDLQANVVFEQSAGVTATQTLYSVAGAEPGNWQMQIIGDTDAIPNDFFVFDMNNTPAPTWVSGPTLAPTANPLQGQVSWQLLAAHPATQISIYANHDKQLSQTLTYTNSDGSLVSTVTEIFAGIPVAQGIATAVDGSAQTHTLDLAALPSGEYTLWMDVNDGENPSIRRYLTQGGATARVTVDQTATFPTDWSTPIDTDIDIANGTMAVQWDYHAHPDIDSYTVRIRSTDPLSPTVETVRELEVGISGDGARGMALVDLIAPGQQYHIAIGAVDLDEAGAATRTVWSQDRTVQTPQPDFFLSTSGSGLQVTAGDTALAVPLTLDLASDLPYPVTLDADFARLPDGIQVGFTRDVVTPTTASGISAQIIVGATVRPGHYVVPIVARSGRLERVLNLSIAVMPGADVPGSSQFIYLPLINR